MIYFAYGSNMLTRRLEKRIGTVKLLGTGILKQHKFSFNKKSKDGSLKADAFYTGDNADEVIGVLFEITDSQKKSLDKAEGLGYGYDLKTVKVSRSDQIIDVVTYVSTDNDQTGVNAPYNWYSEIIIAGAMEHNLPSAYIEIIKSNKTKIDLDSSRSVKELSIIS